MRENGLLSLQRQMRGQPHAACKAEKESHRRQTDYLLLNKPIVTACASCGFDRHGETRLSEDTL